MTPHPTQPYRGRIAPSPTGYLHLGHARTFWIAQQRCQQNQGTLLLRNEDLDDQRCQPQFVEAMFEDLKWLGLQWQEGPDIDGPHASYHQSQRLHLYQQTFLQLQQLNLVYPCSCSRREILNALSAPHASDEEPLYPGTCRPNNKNPHPNKPVRGWRFIVPHLQPVRFTDANLGPQEFIAGKDFGDFLVWRHDNIPSYQLAVTTDDHLMGITEVVRGEDLLLSTARQILLYQALQWPIPAFYHCPLMTDEHGVRLAKRNDALSLRTLRLQGTLPTQLTSPWSNQP
ncbi:MAG: hypothetical protein RI897_1320 [Verrucomicrobiota bacterium]|jgi:glutamyl-tRNA synthetase